MNALFFKLLLIASIFLVPFIVGFLDGCWKRKGTANHKLKWFFWLGLIVIAYFKLEIEPLISMLSMIKPLHDLGYTHGYNRKNIILEIGTTSIDDLIIRFIFRIRDYQSQGLRILLLLYYVVIFTGTLVLVEFIIRRG